MNVPYPPIKRGGDVLLAAAGLLTSLPIMAGVAVFVRRELGSPILFRQTRPGLNGQPFELVKFRTMLTPSQADGRTADGDRITPFGRWLRATSLDELPTLWNVLKGDMSLVGPRPLLMEYQEVYTPRQRTRQLVRPGVTGLAQINGRNCLPWEERLELDARYVEDCGPVLDLNILVRTVGHVLRRRGVSAPGHVTMPSLLDERAAATLVRE